MKCPTQLLFASSMNDTECKFYKLFVDYAIKMFAGDRDYFVTSMPCSIPLDPLLDGVKCAPLLKQSQIDNEMRVNPQKALREYFNQPTAEHEDQMVKNANIIRNSTILLPELCNIDKKSKIIIASDPSRSGDNSILGMMKICHDDNVGIYGEVINCINLIDVTKKRKMSMKIPDQIKVMQENLLLYNGEGNPDYSQIEEFLMDAGSGGQPSGFADNFMEDWLDAKGNLHKGFIDETHDLYSEESVKYPNASRNFKLINPKKYRLQMCEELVELMSLDLIKFTIEYDGKDHIVVESKNPKTGEIELVDRKLSMDEQIALISIDLMKSELLAIHKYKDSTGNIIKYVNPDQHAKDDRFYVLLLLAHKLYELRRKDLIKTTNNTVDLSTRVRCVSSIKF